MGALFFATIQPATSSRGNTYKVAVGRLYFNLRRQVSPLSRRINSPDKGAESLQFFYVRG